MSSDDEIELRKLNAIVGAAIKVMIESGADDEFIGSSAASYRRKVAKILGEPVEALDLPDLLSIVSQAVRQALTASKEPPVEEAEAPAEDSFPIRRRNSTH